MDTPNQLLKVPSPSKIEKRSMENEKDGDLYKSLGDIAIALDPDFDKSQICKVSLNLKKIGREKKLAFLLENVFSVQECKDLIKFSEKEGYTTAFLNNHKGGEIYNPDKRDSLRCIIDNKEFVRILQDRISEFIPETFLGKELVEINERLRFLRYDPGNQFKMHRDGAYSRPDGSARTLITLQIYLNEGFKGGETTFFKNKLDSDKNILPVVPKTGMILVFQHDMLHEGSLLKAGRKYTIRTDVLYVTAYAKAKLSSPMKK